MWGKDLLIHIHIYLGFFLSFESYVKNPKQLKNFKKSKVSSNLVFLSLELFNVFREILFVLIA